MAQYIDQAFSARSDKRPEFQRMIKESSSGKFEILIVHKLDRFSRDRYDSAFYKHILKNNGVRLQSVVEDLENSPELGFDPKSVSAMLENIVYFELLRRGYEVYIGKNETKEIDFVAVRRNERVYVQVCRNLPEDSDRELANLLEIKDHYFKFVVTLDELALGNVNKVKIVHLADFLLGKF